MTKPKAINREKLVAFVLSIIAKGVDLMPNEKLEKLKHEQYVAERKLTAAKHKEKRLESEIKRLTRKGIFISDSIMSDLLWVDN